MTLSRHWLAPLAAALLAAGCSDAVTGLAPLMRAKANMPQAAAATPTPSPAARTVSMRVLGPGALGTDAKIVSSAAAPLIDSSGHILTDALGAYRLAATEATVPVSGASVQLQTLAGTPVGSLMTSGSDGSLSVSAPDGAQLVAVAAFQVGSKIYRQAALLPPGAAPSDAVLIDPINTMVEARVRSLLGDRQESDVLDFDALKRVWSICNDLGVTIDPEKLRADTPAETARAALVGAWEQALAAVKDDDAKADLATFVSVLKGEEPANSADQ